jgi:DNA-directed RNA polymerase
MSVSFCFEYVRFINFINDINRDKFETYLPIQVDASCNGYQHISLLTREVSVLKYLNLAPSTTSDPPQDFYGYVLVVVNAFVMDELEKDKFTDTEVKKGYIRLSKVKLLRSMIKKAVMTYSYNTSNPAMVDYIKGLLVERKVEFTPEEYEQLDKKIDYKKYHTYYLVDPDDIENYLTYSDINIFVKTFTITIKNVFPRMHELKLYTRDIVKICTKLNIPMP